MTKGRYFPYCSNKLQWLRSYYAISKCLEKKSHDRGVKELSKTSIMQFCRVESEQTACLLTVQPFNEKRKRKLEKKKTSSNKAKQKATKLHGFRF